MSKLLVIQSDFGLGDGAVSAMHGVANIGRSIHKSRRSNPRYKTL